MSALIYVYSAAFVSLTHTVMHTVYTHTHTHRYPDSGMLKHKHAQVCVCVCVCFPCVEGRGLYVHHFLSNVCLDSQVTQDAVT